MAEIKSTMAIEVEKTDKTYTVLHGKADVVANAIPNIKESILKVDLSSQPIVPQESIFQLITKIERNIKTKLATILELVLHLPTNALHAVQVSQAGDKAYAVVGSSKD
ncbi:unnamed protein product [Lactuca saligna]|uniref:Uncharacterized protein n=1 Tax=Lactuca saligna TaxID=75948 RepID=A0AA35URD3_LACSI|nr:unnamed protein product [Lactuca saligna]